MQLPGFILASTLVLLVAQALPAGAAELWQSEALLPPPIETPVSLPPVQVCKDKVFAELENFQAPEWSAKAMDVQVLPAGMAVADQLALKEFACIQTAEKSWVRDGHRVIVRVCKFENSAGAYGAYSLLRQGAGTVVVCGDGSSEDDQNLSFWQDNYFVYATAADEDDQGKEMMRRLARRLSLAIAGHGELPWLVSSLPQLNKVAGSEKFIMGTCVARRLLSLPYIKQLGIERSRAAAVADYQFQEPGAERLKLLLIDYGDTQVALAAYRQYCEALAETNKQITAGPAATFKVHGLYLYCQAKGGLLAVIAGARHSSSLLYLSRQVNYF